jgi:hypothetical protein
MSYAMRARLLLGFLMMTLPAWAATGPTITSVSGASGFSGTGTPTIFGGLAGDATGTDPYTPANSCVGTMSCTRSATHLCPCNTARIFNSLILTIGLQNPAAANGGAATTVGSAYVTASSTSGTTSSSGQTVNLQPPQNGGTSVSMPWSTLCSLAGYPNCDDVPTTGVSLTLNIFSDTNNNGVDSADPSTQVTVKIIKPDPETYAVYGGGVNQGIGSFTPYPGDGKIYIKDPQTTSDFPYLGYNSTIKAVRVFVSETNLPDANPQAATKTQDLPVSDDGASLAKNIVDGLDNGTRYFFRLGMVDEAQNVVMYSPDPTVDTDAANTDCSSPPAGDTNGCKYSVKPDQVEGLLPNDFNCFVATAAYGSMLEPKLATFREFRRRVLLTTAIGRRFNHWYYRYGPYAARFLNDRPAWRAVTRAALWPAYGLSWLSLRFGFINVMLAAGLLTSAVVVGRRRGSVPRA